MYLLLLERIERRVLADRAVAELRGVDLPNAAAEMEQFTEALHAEPAPMTPVDLEQFELNRALGVA